MSPFRAIANFTVKELCRGFFNVSVEGMHRVPRAYNLYLLVFSGIRPCDAAEPAINCQHLTPTLLKSVPHVVPKSIPMVMKSS